MGKILLAALLALGMLVGCRGDGGTEDAVRQSAAGGTIRVRVTGLDGDQGQVLVSLFASEEGFPDSADKALQFTVVQPDEEDCSVQLGGVPPGKYAISVLHDENANGKMDSGLWGLPAEGYGASKNPEPRMGPPRFEDASFVLETDWLELEVVVRYLTARVEAGQE
jgi:uncharacterized protein (DUF2141 family)